MGYDTQFRGRFDLDRPLTQNQALYLKKFADTRRMFRSQKATAILPDEVRIAVHLPPGIDGEFYVGDDINEAILTSVIDYNEPPRTQPGLWCQWVPTQDLQGIEWDGGEKFYRYKEWFAYICHNFLTPWGYKVSGSVRWRGEEFGDDGEMDGADIQDNATQILSSYINNEYSNAIYNVDATIWENKYLQTFFLRKINNVKSNYEKLYTRFKTPGDPLNAYEGEEPLPEVLRLLLENDLIKTEKL